MPLTVLVPLIIVGITAVLLAVHFIGGTKEVALTENDARARFMEDFPHAEIVATHISKDAKSAWLALKDPSSIGFMQRLGSGTVVRTLSTAEINHAEFQETQTTLHLNDFTMKTVIIDGKPDALRSALAVMKETAK